MKSRQLGLSGLRENGRPVQWYFEMEDSQNELYLQMNCVHLPEEYRITKDINKVIVRTNASSSDMRDHLLQIDEHPLDIQNVALSFKRVDASSFRVSYRIMAGDAFIAVYEGETVVADMGVTLLAATVEAIEALIEQDYGKYEKRIEWGRSDWGAMATLTFP